MNHDNWIVPPDCAKLIYNLAPLSFISSAVGLYNGHYDLCIVPFSVGCSTLLYWKKPISGWRRNVDICISSCGLLYQIYYIYTLEQYIISYYFCKYWQFHHISLDIIILQRVIYGQVCIGMQEFIYLAILAILYYIVYCDLPIASCHIFVDRAHEFIWSWSTTRSPAGSSRT